MKNRDIEANEMSPHQQAVYCFAPPSASVPPCEYRHGHAAFNEASCQIQGQDFRAATIGVEVTHRQKDTRLVFADQGFPLGVCQ